MAGTQGLLEEQVSGLGPEGCAGIRQLQRRKSVSWGRSHEQRPRGGDVQERMGRTVRLKERALSGVSWGRAWDQKGGQ